MSKGITLFEEEAETLTRLLMSKFGMRMNGAGYTPREYATRENTDRRYAAEENNNDRSFFENERQPEAVSNVPEASELEMTEAAVEGSARPEPVAEIVAACVAETAAHMEEFSVGNKETAAHMEESLAGNKETAAYMEDAADGAADGNEEAEAATAEEQF